jgi:MYXO-CTERM domain-containing protein
MAKAWALYGAGACVFDFAALHSSGVVHVALLLPAVLLTLAFGWFSLFVLGFGGMFGWAYLTAIHPAIGSAVYGAFFGAVTALSLSAQGGAGAGPTIFIGLVVAVAMGAVLYATARRRRRS